LATIVILRRKEKGLAISGLLGVLFAVLVAGLLLVAIRASGTPKKVQPASPKLSKIEQPNVPGSSKQEQYNIQLATVAANRDFPGFLTGAWSRKMDYGFKATDEQNDVSLAEPVLVYSIDEKIVGNLNGVAGLVAAVKPIGELIYPVQVKQEYRSLFGVRLRSNNEWRGTYLGNPYLAASLQGIRKAWPSKDGDGFKLVSCIQPRSFFFIALNSDKPNLTPVTRVVVGSGQYLVPPADWKIVTPAETVLESLKLFWKSGAVNGIGQFNDANQ
jgi:hypothetical protein